MLPESQGGSLPLPLEAGVLPSHHPLEIGKLPDHRGGQVGPGEKSGPLGGPGLAAGSAQSPGDLPGQGDQPPGLVQVGSQSPVKDDPGEFLHPLGQRPGLVLPPEEAGVGEAGPQDLLVIFPDRRRLPVGTVGDQEKFRRQAPVLAEDREVALVNLHHRDRDLGREGEETGLETAPDNPGVFDQPDHLFKQPGIDRFPAGGREMSAELSEQSRGDLPLALAGVRQNKIVPQ